MCDVIFDKTLFYDPKEPDLWAPVAEHVEEIIKSISLISIPESTALVMQLDNISSSLQKPRDRMAQRPSSCSCPEKSGVEE
jgi:hypothetical protein